jgi:hypothetical protein
VFADSYQIDEGSVLDVTANTGVLANDVAATTDVLTAVLVSGSGPAHGSLTLNSVGSFIYAPNAGFNGIDSFTYLAGNSGGDSTPSTLTITVNNVAPVIEEINNSQFSTYVIAVDEPALFSGSFTDVGTLDTHTAVWKFSHVVSLATVTTTQTVIVNQAAGSGSVSDSLLFADAGVYTVTLTITDKENGEASSAESMFVVYDPSAGFVTGGGWFISPENAYIADLSLTGKANFGFVAKYKKGGTTLTGQTEFQFKTANLNFHSDEYIWLVIAGARAQYQGTGTINGSENYGFKLTAIDGQVSGGGGEDRIRLKIWDKDNGDAIVYDSGLGVSDDETPSMVLGGGKIIIHSQGNALQATGGAVIGGTAVQSLSYATLQPVVNQAIENWVYAGADASQLNALSQIDVHLANLSGSYLGMASVSSHLIWIDVDAAGYGWRSGGMDLLSTVSHELGHQIGLDHGVMGTTLALGSRYLISSGLATETRRLESPLSSFSFYEGTRTSSLTDNSDSEQIDVDILESAPFVPRFSLGREEEDLPEKSGRNESDKFLVDDKSADDLFAEFNESLLDDLLAV